MAVGRIVGLGTGVESSAVKAEKHIGAQSERDPRDNRAGEKFAQKLRLSPAAGRYEELSEAGVAVEVLDARRAGDLDVAEDGAEAPRRRRLRRSRVGAGQDKAQVD